MIKYEIKKDFLKKNTIVLKLEIDGLEFYSKVYNRCKEIDQWFDIVTLRIDTINEILEENKDI